MSSEESYLGLHTAAADELEQDEAQALAARIEQDDLKMLMSNASGRRFMWKLLGDCRIFHSNFSTSALEMARREGRREIGLKLLEQVHLLCPERYEEMRKEQLNGKRQRRPRSTEQHRVGPVDE